MADHVANPRRSPRANIRCSAQVEAGRQVLATETEDVGPHGCQVVLPTPHPVGQALRITLTAPGAGAPIAVPARIIWTSSRAPWRVGLAFDAAVFPATTAWWDRLVAANPGLGKLRRAPERLPLDAMVYLGAPPRFTDFTEDELMVLSYVGNGTTVADLQSRLGERWSVGQRMLFALLTRGLLTISKSSAAHVAAWRQIMRDAGSAFHEPDRQMGSVTRSWLLAVGGPGGAEGAAGAPSPGPASGPALTPAPVPVPARAPPAAPRAAAAVVEPDIDVEIEEEPAPVDHAATAGSGWRGAKHARNGDAQRALELGRSELEGGRARSAVALLRMALQHAPGDEEIAALLARALRG